VSSNVAALVAAEESAGLYAPDVFAAFNRRVHAAGKALRARLAGSRDRTGRALAYGSSVGCAALIQYFDLGGYIDAIFDDTPLTNLVRTRAGEVPVLAGPQLGNEPATEVVVLAWRYAERIAAAHAEYRARGGRFYRALGDLECLEEPV
jgi:hypothetical protein